MDSAFAVLEIKSIRELLELRDHLEAAIALDPDHTARERVELQEAIDRSRTIVKADGKSLVMEAEFAREALFKGSAPLSED